MYKEHTAKQTIIAVVYYVLLIAGFLTMGICHQRQIDYEWIYWGLFLIPVAVVLLGDRNINDLGFSGEFIKNNWLISLGIITVVVVISFLFSDRLAGELWRGIFYYLFRIAFVEEVIFRGFLQNYLFGFRMNRKYAYLLGAAFFSLMHLPFQMYVNGMVSIQYVLVAAPQLCSTFLCHLLMCWITYKRKDITIPTALHFAIDYLYFI